MMWKIPRIWEDGDVWILGGGPSVLAQFNIPKEVQQSVLDGTSPPNVYSEYFSPLHDKHVIGINIAYMIGDWIDMVFFGDSGFFLANKTGLAKYKGICVSCHPSIEKYEWVKFVGRDTKHPQGISPNPYKVSWNENSGAAAISLAAHSGAKRIILLGFDMKLNSDQKQHWHGVYRKGGGSAKPKNRPNSLPFDRHLKGFNAIARDAKALGIEILNANPDSAITVFPKYTIKELLYDNS